MKVIIKRRFVLAVVAGLVALGAGSTALADVGCIQGPNGTAKPIVFGKGKLTCSSILNYTGDVATKGVGTIEIRDPGDNSLLTTITSTVESDGSVSWSSTGPAKLNAVIVNGVPGGNFCEFEYPLGEGVAQSGIGYNTANAGDPISYSNVQEVYYCTDTTQEVVETQPDTVPCSELNLDPADDSCNHKVGAIVEVWTPTYDENGAVTGQALQSCVCDKDADGNTVQVNIYPCELTGTDDGDPATVKNCFKSNVEAPYVIEYYPDATRCSTKSGTRSCDCIDNPFTACNECTDSSCI